MSVPVHLRLLGSFELQVNGQAVTTSPNTARTLAILALERGMTRSQLAGILWPEKNECRARANLRSTLLRLRKAGVNAIEDGSLFTLALAPHVSLDFRSWSMSEEADLLDLDTLLTDLLPDWNEPWLELHRIEWRQVRLHEVDCLCASFLLAGEWNAARSVAERALQAEPLRESLTRHLVEACVRQGDLVGARTQIENYRRLLATEIGVAPSQQFEVVQQHVLTAR